ncbi:MAG: pyridoxal phosphate-dependent aminotransferase family protein [archaeon]|nr:pyridoxal phosphate-dependent aminotransferase family protein [archaeon]
MEKDFEQKIEGKAIAKTIIDGKEYDYFYGTGYYCLQDHPDVINASIKAIENYGIKQGTSHYKYGINPIYEELKKNASQFFGTESVLFYPSGYFGSTIILQGLKDEFDIIFIDEETHYSGQDAAIASQKPIVKFKHLDSEDLKIKITKNLKSNQKPLILCDGAAPVTGKIPLIPKYLEIIEDIKGAKICVDDAHAVGILGKHGRGTYDYYNLKSDRLFSSGTMSKAIGGYGGIIAGSKKFIEKLKKNSNIDAGTTNIPIPAAAASAKGFEILMKNPKMREKIWDNSKYVKSGFRKLGFEIEDTVFPIVSLISFNNLNLANLHEYYKKNLILANFVGEGEYSSAPIGGSIKITIFSTHSMEQLNRLLLVTKEFLNHFR